jgi:hypothetical protein
MSDGMASRELAQQQPKPLTLHGFPCRVRCLVSVEISPHTLGSYSASMPPEGPCHHLGQGHGAWMLFPEVEVRVEGISVIPQVIVQLVEELNDPMVRSSEEESVVLALLLRSLSM